MFNNVQEDRKKNKKKTQLSSVKHRKQCNEGPKSKHVVSLRMYLITAFYIEIHVH